MTNKNVILAYAGIQSTRVWIPSQAGNDRGIVILALGIVCHPRENGDPDIQLTYE